MAIKTLLVSGNVVIVLAIVYYYFVGTAVSSSEMDTFVRSTPSSTWRSTVFFFDYGYDFCFYIGLVSVINMALFVRTWDAPGRLVALLCTAAGVVVVLLIGERGGIVMLITPLLACVYFLAKQVRLRTRVVQRSVVLILVIALVGVGYQAFAAPEQMTRKLDSLRSAESKATLDSTLAMLDLPAWIDSLISQFPIADFGVRLALNANGVMFFFNHPLGVGFGGEVQATGWYSHYELTTIAVEQGVPGVLCFGYLFLQLWRFVRRGQRPTPDAEGDLYVIRSLTVGFVLVSLTAMGALFLVKFGLVYWSLLGVFDVSVRRGRNPMGTNDEPRRRRRSRRIAMRPLLLPNSDKLSPSVHSAYVKG